MNSTMRYYHNVIANGNGGWLGPLVMRRVPGSRPYSIENETSRVTSAISQQSSGLRRFRFSSADFPSQWTAVVVHFFCRNLRPDSVRGVFVFRAAFGRFLFSCVPPGFNRHFLDFPPKFAMR